VSEEILGERQLNRALLARQLLLERATGSLEAAVEQAGGLQTQVSRSGYIGLWTRQAGLTRQAYTDALLDRRLIQATILRGTIHTVTAADYWPMTIAVRRSRQRWYMRAWGSGHSEASMRRAADATRRALADGPLPLRELRARLADKGGDASPAGGFGLWVDLVRVPPPGTWDRPRADLYGLAEAWLPPDDEVLALLESDAQEWLLRRYLAGFGPASLADASNWMGVAVADLRPIAAGMELRRFRDEKGRPLLDLPGASLPDPQTPAPPRFLPSFDANLLIQARRTQILPEEFRPHIFNVRTPQSWNTFLLDGQVAGTWTFADGRVTLDPLRTLSRAERGSLDQELHRLQTFLFD
jgi:hypothetical protein